MTSRAAGSRARAIHKRREMQGRASSKLRNIDEKIPIFVLRGKDSSMRIFFIPRLFLIVRSTPINASF